MVTHGIIENRFLHVNKLEKRNGWKIKKTAGHVLWPEVKIRVWYPGERTLDISRQALKDVSVCCLKDEHSLILPHKSCKKTQCWLLFQLNWFPTQCLDTFQSPAQGCLPTWQKTAPRDSSTPPSPVFISPTSWSDHSADRLTKLNTTIRCVFSLSNHQRLILINPAGWAQL